MKFSFSINLLSVLILAACAQQPVQKPQVALPSVSVDNHAPEQGTGLTEQKLIRAKHYMAASANPLATEAGYENFEARRQCDRCDDCHTDNFGTG